MGLGTVCILSSISATQNTLRQINVISVVLKGIGMRLGKLQTKVGLISMLHKFRYELDERLKNSDMKFDPRHFLLQPQNDIFLHIFKR